MVMCYILGPFHNQINEMLHFLSHELEMPDTIISHSDNSVDSHNEGGHYALTQTKHDHGFLEFLNKFLEVSDTESDNENPNTIKQKIDKHIRIKKKMSRFYSLTFESKSVWFFIQECMLEGYIFKVFQPPQYFD